MLKLRFEATVIEWRGPSPFFFAPVPGEHAGDVRATARLASYGWGVIPVTAVIGGVRFTTSLFPKGETYLLPIKMEVRKRCGVTAGDVVEVEMGIGV